MKRNEAVAPDGILISAYSALGDIGMEVIFNVLNICLGDDHIPDESGQSTITHIYKKSCHHVI